MKGQDNLTSDSYLKKKQPFLQKNTTWLKNVSDNNYQLADSKGWTIEFAC